MAEELNAKLSMDSSEWGNELSKAERAAAAFLAYMEKFNGNLAAVSKGTMSAANAIAALGGVSAAVGADIEALAENPRLLDKISGDYAQSAQQMRLAVERILEGNEKSLGSVKRLEKEYEKYTVGLGTWLEMAKRVKKMQAEIAANQIAAAQRRATGQPDQGIAARLSDPAAYLSKDPKAFDTADKIAMARKVQQLERIMALTGTDFKTQAPPIEMGEGKHSLNIARYNMVLAEQARLLQHITQQRREDAAWEKKAAVQREKDYQLRKRDHEQELAYYAELRRVKAAAATRTARELAPMYQRGPGLMRAQVLYGKGIITNELGTITGVMARSTNIAHGFFNVFQKGTSLATKGTMTLVRGLQSANSTMAMMTSSFSGLMVMIGGATMGAFFKMSMDFEKSMARVNLLVKQGESDIGTLTAQVKELSRQFGIMPMDMAEGFRIAISSDVAPGEVMQFMKEAAKLAVTHNASIEKTADLLSMLRNAFNLTTQDLSHVRDMIFVLTDRGRTEVEQFAAEIGKIAPTARLAGVKIEEMMAAFGALSRTRGTEQAGTLLRNLFKNIIEPSKDAKTQLKKVELGLTATQTAAYGFINTVTRFGQALKKEPELLNEFAEDLRELAAWGDLTSVQFDALTTSFESMFNTVGIGNEKQGAMLETTALRWDRITAQMKISAIETGQSFVNMFAGITTGADTVEIAQMKIESAFKRIEIAVRVFVGIFNLMVLGLTGPLAVVYGALRTIWNGLQQIWEGFSAKNTWDEMEKVRDRLTELYEERDALMKDGQKTEANELTLKINELMEREDRLNQLYSQKMEGVDINVKDIAEGWKQAGGAMDMVAGTLSSNADEIARLSQEVAGLNMQIENSVKDAEALARYKKLNGNPDTKLGTMPQPVRDTVAAEAERLRLMTEQMVKMGRDSLKQWVVDNRDTITGMITGYRKLATEQKSLVTHMRSELKDLIKDQRKFDDSIQDTINKIKDVDDKKKSPIDRLKERGKRMEERANEAAKEGDRNEVQRLLQEAMGYYEEILNVADTKGNRKVVVEALERLKKGMDDVYGKEKISLEDRIAAAEEASQKFVMSANVIEANFKQLEQGIRDVTREIETMGKTPSIEVLNKLKSKIAELMGSTDLFLASQVDPTLQALDKMIEKAKELGAEMKKAFGVEQFDRNVEYLSKEPDFVPIQSAPSTTNTSIRNRITNVDAVHVNLASGGDDGPKKVDARRLARDIKRYIDRGEATFESR